MATKLTTEYVPTDSLRPHPDNPRRGDLSAIQESLCLHGQYKPIVVNRATMHVLAGNHLVEAARGLGWSQIAVNFVDVDDEQARRVQRRDRFAIAPLDRAGEKSRLSPIFEAEGRSSRKPSHMVLWFRRGLEIALDPLEVAAHGRSQAGVLAVEKRSGLGQRQSTRRSARIRYSRRTSSSA